jgi:N-acetylmuramoyl-L-alanine amidase
MVSVEGRIVRLGRAAQEAEGCLWLPEEFLTAVLPLVLGGAVSVGGAPEAVSVPPTARETPTGRVSVDVTVGSDLVKVTLSGPGAPQAEVAQKGREVEVRLAGETFVAPARDLGKGIVERVAPDQEGRLLRIRLGERFGRLESQKKSAPPSLVLLLRGQAQELPLPEAPAVQSGAPPEGRGPTPAEPALKPPSFPVKTPAVDVVVIDPGHGGSDTGALGPQGVAEKDLTLALARKLETLLEKKGFRVVLTRSEDSSVPLKQRAALANFNQADLFLSIHMNASPAASARGPEVYFMSQQATDLWSRELAEKENAAGDGASRGGGLDLVLWDLAQAAHLQESAFLAETIQNALNGLMGTDRRAVRQAPFVVLEGATMPAVLVEVAFLSNPEEFRKINDPAFQDRVAERLAEAVAAFKERYESPPAPSGDQ